MSMRPTAPSFASNARCWCGWSRVDVCTARARARTHRHATGPHSSRSRSVPRAALDDSLLRPVHHSLAIVRLLNPLLSLAAVPCSRVDAVRSPGFNGVPSPSLAVFIAHAYIYSSRRRSCASSVAPTFLPPSSTFLALHTVASIFISLNSRLLH